MGVRGASLIVNIALFLLLRSGVWLISSDFPGDLYAWLVCTVASSLRLDFTNFVTI